MKTAEEDDHVRHPMVIKAGGIIEDYKKEETENKAKRKTEYWPNSRN